MDTRLKIIKVKIFQLMNALIADIVHSIPNLPKVTELTVDQILLVQFPTAHFRKTFIFNGWCGLESRSNLLFEAKLPPISENIPTAWTISTACFPLEISRFYSTHLEATQRKNPRARSVNLQRVWLLSIRHNLAGLILSNVQLLSNAES